MCFYGSPAGFFAHKKAGPISLSFVTFDPSEKPF